MNGFYCTGQFSWMNNFCRPLRGKLISSVCMRQRAWLFRGRMPLNRTFYIYIQGIHVADECICNLYYDKQMLPIWLTYAYRCTHFDQIYWLKHLKWSKVITLAACKLASMPIFMQLCYNPSKTNNKHIKHGQYESYHRAISIRTQRSEHYNYRSNNIIVL